MPFAGLDLHKKQVEAVVLDQEGAITFRARFAATREGLEEFARRHLGPDYHVALEATTNTWAVAGVLEPFVAEVVISNPMRTRAIAEAKIKTDRVDAAVLAHLLRTDYLPRVWQPDEETRRLRRESTDRANLAADRTRIKNRIHAVLHQRLIPAPAGDLFGKRNLAWLRALPLDAGGRQTLERHLHQLQMIEADINDVQDNLAQHAYRTPEVKLLMTIPGVDFTVAETLLAVLGDIHRFPTPDQAASYLGLVPSTYQSGEHCYHGRITKQGSGHARWMMVQAAQHLGTHPGPLGVFFRRLLRKKNRNVAVVASARKLVTIAWHLLTNNEPYRYALPDGTRAKFARLRIRASGARRRGGHPKGAPRPAAYGSGQGSRAIPSLDAVYDEAALPPLAPPAAGEQRMLADQRLEDFAVHIQQPRRVPRAPDRKKQRKNDDEHTPTQSNEENAKTTTRKSTP